MNDQGNTGGKNAAEDTRYFHRGSFNQYMYSHNSNGYQNILFSSNRYQNKPMRDSNAYEHGTMHQYRRKLFLAEGVLQQHKETATVQTRKNTVTGRDHPFDPEYNFVSRFPVDCKGCFICGSTDHFNSVECPVGINSREERQLFFNEMWTHKPHTNKRNKDGTPVSF